MEWKIPFGYSFRVDARELHDSFSLTEWIMIYKFHILLFLRFFNGSILYFSEVMSFVLKKIKFRMTSEKLITHSNLIEAS